ncbi:diguanylate cyclase [Alloiococcus sp. CFN-8]|uniref:sensor domain-containing diguanylate cyclase n=1 Tax=Alloiococcus sp. CFN-8 TaxID=3416081 RepID=UPI003CED5BC4
MDDYREAYNLLMKEFLSYQALAEDQIQTLSEKNIKLEKSLDAFFNIIEISKYINSYLSSESLTQRINDMIIGILGATYSSIYLKEDGYLRVRASNCRDKDLDILEKAFHQNIENGNPFVMNSAKPLYGNDSKRGSICSVIGVPIKLRGKFAGYIIVEHTHCNFFNNDHIKFISSIANQIGIALENSLLYRKIKESSKRDPALNIYHRKYFVDFLSRRINQNNSPFAVVMIDFDDFKAINDSCGHPFGDMVLTETVRLIEKNISKGDILARYGGEELVLFIDNPPSKEALFEKINIIRDKISNNELNYRGRIKTITASFGISLYPEDGSNVEELLFIADGNLYKAKDMGKNSVVLMGV